MAVDDYVVVPVRLRSVTLADRAYIVSTWVADWENKPEYKWCPKKVFRKYFRGHLLDVLKRYFVIVACNPEDEEQLFGFAVLDPLYRWKYGNVRSFAKGTVVEPLLAAEAQRIYEQRDRRYKPAKGVFCEILD